MRTDFENRLDKADRMFCDLVDFIADLRNDLENRLEELNMESRNLSDTVHEYLYNNANSTVRWANERLDEVRDEREYIEEYLSDLEEIVNSYLDEI